MSAERLANRYAKSLIDLSQELGKLETVKSDMEVLLNAVKNRDLLLLLKSPIVSKLKKASVLEALFGEGFDELSFSFLDVLLTKSRESFIPEITSEFLDQYNVIKGISKVVLTTAAPIGDQAIANIKNKLNRSDKIYGEVAIEVKVDKELIGGFKLEINDQLYDASLSHRLQELRKTLSN